jgi:hypothetical protein
MRLPEQALLDAIYAIYYWHILPFADGLELDLLESDRL